MVRKYINKTFTNSGIPPLNSHKSIKLTRVTNLNRVKHVMFKKKQQNNRIIELQQTQMPTHNKIVLTCLND